MKNLFLCIAVIISAILPGTAQTFQWVTGGGGSQSANTLTNGEQVRYMCTDSNRNLYVVSTVLTQSLHADTFYTSYGHYPFNPQLLLSSYRCDGTMRWARLFEGYTDVIAGGLVYDGAGCVYMGADDGGWGYPLYLGDGIGTNAQNNKTTFLVKYDTSGNKQWIQFIGPATATSVVNTHSAGLALDGQGNVHHFVSARTGNYIAPGVTSIKGTYDVKYSSTGTLISANRLNIDSSYSTISCATISKRSNKLFAIVNQDPNIGNGMFLAALTPAGNVIWKDSVSGYSTINTHIYDGNNALYVAHSAFQGQFKFQGNTVNNTSYSVGALGLVSKVDTNGNIKWIYKNESLNSNGQFVSITQSTPTTIIAGGNFAGVIKHGNDSLTTPANVGSPYYTVMDTAGNFISTAKLNASGLYDNITALASDKAGSVYMGGLIAGNITIPGHTYSSNGGQTDFYIAKFGYACNCVTPAANFTSVTTAVKTVQFTYTGTSAGIDSLVWNFGDGQKQKVTTGFTTPIAHTYLANGHYAASATAYSGCGINTFSKGYALSVGGMASLDGVRIYPNPVTDNLMIEGAEGAAYTILNTTGQRVAFGTLAGSRQSIPITILPAGLYIIRLVNAKCGQEVVTFIKR